MAQAAFPPAPRGKPFVGNMTQFSEDGLNFLLKMREMDDFTSFKFGPFRAYSANSPDSIHEVLVTKADKFHKSANLKRVLDPLLGQGLFTSDGDLWKRQRRLVQPAFHTKRIGAYGEVMVDYTLTMLESWRDGQTHDIDREISQLTMGIISKLLFDAEVGAESDQISDSVTTALKVVNDRLSRILIAPPWLPTAENKRYFEAVATLDKLIYRFIQERRQSGEDKGDVLSMLLNAQEGDDGIMTDLQVRNEAMTLFGAGHETTAVTLTWTFYLLSQHPDIVEKLHAELESVLAGRAPTLEDLPQLRYTEQIIKESMRMYPPAWGASRDAIEPVEIAGYALPKRAPVIINIWGVHHDPRFFPNPDQFDPERFTPEAEKALPRYAYLPFGGGPRVCIGNALAMMEAKLVLATIAQRFTLALAPGQAVEPERSFTLRPKFGMRMVARERVPVLA